MVAMTPIPEVPPEILGAIDVRGEPVLVLDMRRRFRLPPQAPSLNSPLIIVTAHGKPLAALVDRVGNVVRAETEPDATGLMHVHGRLTVMLDPDRLPTEQLLSLLE